jgi:hypothetical protein
MRNSWTVNICWQLISVVNTDMYKLAWHGIYGFTIGTVKNISALDITNTKPFFNWFVFLPDMTLLRYLALSLLKWVATCEPCPSVTGRTSHHNARLSWDMCCSAQWAQHAQRQSVREDFWPPCGHAVNDESGGILQDRSSWSSVYDPNMQPQIHIHCPWLGYSLFPIINDIKLRF